MIAIDSNLSILGNIIIMFISICGSANVAYHVMTIIKFLYVLTKNFKCNKCNF